MAILASERLFGDAFTLSIKSRSCWTERYCLYLILMHVFLYVLKIENINKLLM
jgi:hypothetical protein